MTGMSITEINARIKSPGLRLLDRVLEETIKEQDLREIVGTFVEKSKAGHVGSAKFLLKMLGAEAAPQTIVVNNFETDMPDRQVHAVIESSRGRTPLEKVTVYLSAAGESTPAAIAECVGLDTQNVVRILDDNPSRFTVRGNKYSLAQA